MRKMKSLLCVLLTMIISLGSIKVCRIYGYCIRGVRYILAPFCMLSGKKAGIGGQGRLITYSD